MENQNSDNTHDFSHQDGNDLRNDVSYNSNVSDGARSGEREHLENPEADKNNINSAMNTDRNSSAYKTGTNPDRYNPSQFDKITTSSDASSERLANATLNSNNGPREHDGERNVLNQNMQNTPQRPGRQDDVSGRGYGSDNNDARHEDWQSNDLIDTDINGQAPKSTKPGNSEPHNQSTEEIRSGMQRTDSETFGSDA